MLTPLFPDQASIVWSAVEGTQPWHASTPDSDNQGSSQKHQPKRAQSFSEIIMFLFNMINNALYYTDHLLATFLLA